MMLIQKFNKTVFEYDYVLLECYRKIKLYIIVIICYDYLNHIYTCTLYIWRSLFLLVMIRYYCMCMFDYIYVHAIVLLTI